MSLVEYKIKQSDIEKKGVVSAPDVLSGDPQDNKAIFDRLIREVVAEQFNALVDELVDAGVEMILRRGDNSIVYLRLNADKVLEVSTDGKEYFSTVGSGHIIVDKDGKDVPKGLRLQFDNFEVREEDGTIIVHGVAEEIAGAIPATEKGKPKGVAELDGDGRVIQPQQWQSNPNLLHNWYFGNPVNQRGKTTYDEAGYTIDRWQIITGDSLTVLDDGIEITGSIFQSAVTGGGHFGVPLTLSVLDTENNLYAMKDFTLTAPLQGVSSSAQGAPLLGASSGTDTIRISVTPSENSTIALRAAKLEYGTQQTLAHKDEGGNWVLNEVPDYAEQLALCQRHQVVVQATWYARTVYIGTAAIYFDIPLPVELRGNPSVVGDVAIYALNGEAQSDFSFSYYARKNTNYLRVQANKTSHGLSDASIRFSAGTVIDANL